MNRYYIQVTCDKKSNIHRGLVKWYDRGLQNLWWEFDSLIPCSKNTEFTVFFLYHVAFYVAYFIAINKMNYKNDNKKN